MTSDDWYISMIQLYQNFKTTQLSKQISESDIHWSRLSWYNKASSKHKTFDEHTGSEVGHNDIVVWPTTQYYYLITIELNNITVTDISTHTIVDSLLSDTVVSHHVEAVPNTVASTDHTSWHYNADRCIAAPWGFGSMPLPLKYMTEEWGGIRTRDAEHTWGGQIV